MALDIYSALVTKFSSDALREIKADEQQRDGHQVREQQVNHRCQVAKYALLGIAVLGVACGVYFSHALGGLAADLTTRHEPDPTLIAQPKSTAKHLRRIAELRQQRAQDLEEIEQ